MPRISAAREEATRQRILDAARVVFVEKGLDRASIDDVVAACGLSVGAIYNYFPSKDELIRQSIDDSVRDEGARIYADTRAAGSASEGFERGIRGWWNGTMEVPGGPAFLAQAWAAASRQPLIRDLVARRSERGVTINAMIMREFVDRGELPADLDVDALARTFQALLDGMVIEYVVSGGTLRRADAQNRIFLVMAAALAAARARGAQDAGVS